MADGVSPSAGKDVNGPTAAATSVSRLDHFIVSNGTLFNQKFHPSALSGREGLEKFVALIRSYFDQKGMHMQFNVVDRDTLLDAQKYPEKYKHLVVRVAGYSALFTTLSRSLQDDIIRRTEQGFSGDNMDYLEKRGRIFDIQRYSIHDGPGIRTIVFLKGCVLRCRWCCNPESQEYEIETMRVQGKDKIIGRDVTVREALTEVGKRQSVLLSLRRRDDTFRRRVVSVSRNLAAALLRGAKERGISTAVESMGCAPWKDIENALPWLDTYLMDIKHMNPGKHKEFTGRSNEQMLENARRIALSGKTKLVIRVPVIPTFNDTVEEIQEIAQFAATLPGVDKIHLLPYHRLGQDKYEGLGRDYYMEGILPPEAEHMNTLKKAVERVSSLDCQIGG